MKDRSADSDPARVGILGGTFDPVHRGHLTSAGECAAALDLDRVLFVLSARPPHKPEGADASIDHRWAMLQAATRSDPRFEPSDLEVRRTGPSYTVDTLEQIGRRLPRADLFVILGLDAYLEVDTWHQPGRLLAQAHVVVTSRPGTTRSGGTLAPPVAARDSCCYDPDIGCYVHETGHRLIELTIDALDVSASELRRRARQGQSFSELLPDEVANYVRRHGLYGADPV